MNNSIAPLVDVVIPVFNAPEFTKRCVDSVITHIGSAIQYVLIQDDASDRETHDMLDHLPYQQLRVHHVSVNQGFGASVNAAIERSNANFVLVLNSDTELIQNFLPYLYDAFLADPKLAVISPALQKSNLSRYVRQPGGYVSTYRFQGHAFMVRRQLFLDIGGFDSAYGRGYYEDTDLGRRLDRKDWHIGVHPDARIRHKIGKSFGRGRDYHLLVKRNRNIYLLRYPDASRNLLLVSSSHVLNELSTELKADVVHVLRCGGSVHWLTPVLAPKLLCKGMRNKSVSLVKLSILMLRGFFRADRRISEVYIYSDVSSLTYGLLIIYSRVRKLKFSVWTINRINR